MRPPPARIETERLLLRPYEDADADAFAELLASSRDHYAAYIPFFLDGDPAERVRGYRDAFFAGEKWVYAAFEGDWMVGGGMLFPRIGPDALEVGYHLREDATGRGFATEIAGALVQVGFDVSGARRVEAHISPGNVASVAVAKRLGMHLLREEDDVVRYEIAAGVRSASDRSEMSASASDSASGG